MTVYEYREKHKHCKFCRYINETHCYCLAKERFLIFNLAKRCKLYMPKDLKIRTTEGTISR